MILGIRMGKGGVLVLGMGVLSLLVLQVMVMEFCLMRV